MSNLSTSDERLLDAQEIESLLAQEGLIQRPSVKAHLEALAQKIRRDANAIRRLEDSQAKASASSADPVQPQEQDQSMTDANSAELPSAAQGQSEASVPATVVSAATISPVAAPPTLSSSSVKYKTIDKFSFDSGSYNSPTVTIYIPLPSIGSHPESNIRCNFTKSSFDVTILDLNGANYRLLKDNLEHDIVPEESKMKIKANKIILKLQKVKSDYGMYDTWNELTSKKAKTQSDKNKDPAASIMELMKDMYDQGDDNMKKMIGETMLKQREGRLDSSLDKGMDDLKF